MQTAENFRHGGGDETGGEGFAQPKGVQTRAAIAKHLAAKLKVVGQRKDLEELL